MQNLIIAKVGALFAKRKYGLLLLFISLSFILSGCASSDVARDAASSIDLGVQNAKNLTSGETDIAESYQNANQTTKGALIGGAAGAVTGLVSTSIGFFPGAITGAILGGSYGAYIDANTNIIDQLENRGVNVVVLGDQVLVMVPSARIFVPWTSNIKSQAYSTLNLISCYINGYTKMLVKIAAYTDVTGSPDGDLSLSRQQAEQVEKFLIATGIDARVLYAEGYGGTHLVVRNSGEWDNDNYRIEITLEKLYV